MNNQLYFCGYMSGSQCLYSQLPRGEAAALGSTELSYRPYEQAQAGQLLGGNRADRLKPSGEAGLDTVWSSFWLQDVVGRRGQEPSMIDSLTTVAPALFFKYPKLIPAECPGSCYSFSLICSSDTPPGQCSLFFRWSSEWTLLNPITRFDSYSWPL